MGMMGYVPCVLLLGRLGFFCVFAMEGLSVMRDDILKLEKQLCS
jgi:hypothetical protein